ncbi:MAG: archease [Marine Group I thaumarchaeote]|nr:MAG: archease [Marine Group I thaumarchaeote]
MSIQYLEHTTDAFILVTAPSLTDAFTLAGQSVVDTTLDKKTIEEKEQRTLKVSGKDLRYLLLNWLEEVNYQLITEGFAIARFSLEISKNSTYKLKSTIFGEPINLKKHHFKIEIKAPTFHMMEIKQNGQVTMRFLLDL